MKFGFGFIEYLVLGSGSAVYRWAPALSALSIVHCIRSAKSFCWSHAGVCRTCVLRSPHGNRELIPTGGPNSSSGDLSSSAVQTTAHLMHSPTNLYPWMVKCTMSLERITTGRIHSSLPLTSSGVKTILDSVHFIREMKTPSLKISPMNKLWLKLWGKFPGAQQQGAG